MKLKAWKRFNTTMYVLAFVVIFMSFVFPDIDRQIFAFSGVGVVVVSFLLGLKFWRCPHCNKALPQQFVFMVRDCPFCEKPISELAKK